MSDVEPTAAPAEEQPATKPVRRRRSASRAAGPPQGSDAPVVVETTAPATTPAAEPAAPAPAGPPTPAEPTASTPAEPTPSTTAEPAGDTAEPAAATSRPRRRRAATRPAGKPEPVTAASPVAAPEGDGTPAAGPATTEVAPESPAESPATETPAEPVTKPRRTRKRATKAAAAPAASEEPTDTAAETPAAVPTPSTDGPTTTGAADVDAPAAADAATGSEPTARARSSATAPAAASEVAPETVAAEPAAEKPARRGRRSRPSGRLADPFAPAQPEAPATSPGDDLSAAVRAVFDQAAAGTLATTEDDEDTVPVTGTATSPEEQPEDEQVEDADAADQGVAGPFAWYTGATQDASEDQTADRDEDPAEEQAEDQADDGEDDDDSDGASRSRRRRRRGGRRRRRGGGDTDRSDDAEGADAEDEEPAQPVNGSEDEPAAEDDGAEDQGADGEGEGEANGSDGTRRRRRRRRRRGEEASASEDDPSDTVVRVREPRRSAREKASDQITGIEGSTRLEAKRQRRREGRQSSRRRTPILSEAEFLARREAVERTMIIRQGEDLSQLAVLEDGVLVEHYVDRESATSLIGNVYLGRVQNVLPSMEAAFVDIGRGRNAVLYAGEVDWDANGADKSSRQIEKVLKSGQTVLVQVTKDPVGAKGARLTNHVSIPGRYVVYSPGGHLSGISRKLPDIERKRLKDILSELVPDEASVIVRTAAEGASEDELVRDVNRLKAQWEAIEKKIKTGSAPQLLYAEPDLTLRIVRDLFTEDFAQLVVDGNGGENDAYATVESYVGHVAPHLADRLRRWDRGSDGDVFAAHRLDEQIAKALDRKVFLPSGGSLIIDRTEAMTVIDVNTGKFTGSGGNLESTVTSNNLEAAEEIVRQLRLRDIGGIIVIDFIDMVLPSNRELLLRRLVECLGRDRTRHQVAEVTSLGLVQMTRKKIGTGLAEAFTEPCEHCAGLGYHTHEMPVETQSQADGGERQGRRGRSGRNKGGGGKAEPVAKEPRKLEPVRRHGGPQDVFAAMHAKEPAGADDAPDDDGRLDGAGGESDRSWDGDAPDTSTSQDVTVTEVVEPQPGEPEPAAGQPVADAPEVDEPGAVSEPAAAEPAAAEPPAAELQPSEPEPTRPPLAEAPASDRD